jgi:hypothetical protein
MKTAITPINAEAFWAYFGHTVGQFYLGKLFLDMALPVPDAGNACGPLRASLGFSHSPTRSNAPIKEFHNFIEFLQSRKGMEIGKYAGSGNWMNAQRDLYLVQ